MLFRSLCGRTSTVLATLIIMGRRVSAAASNGKPVNGLLPAGGDSGVTVACSGTGMAVDGAGGAGVALGLDGVSNVTCGLKPSVAGVAVSASEPQADVTIIAIAIKIKLALGWIDLAKAREGCGILRKIIWLSAQTIWLC